MISTNSKIQKKSGEYLSLKRFENNNAMHSVAKEFSNKHLIA
mgnify:FL=1